MCLRLRRKLLLESFAVELSALYANTHLAMSEQASPEVIRVLRQAVLEQVANNDPPETALTLARLQNEGMAEDEAVRWIAARHSSKK